MCPADVVGFTGIVTVAVIVERSDLVTIVDQRDASKRHDHAVKQHDVFNNDIDLGLIMFFQSILQSNQGRQCTGQASIVGFGIVTEKQAVRI
jgi:hypothetical protein